MNSQGNLSPLTIGVVILVFLIGIIFGLMFMDSNAFNNGQNIDEVVTIIIEVKNTGKTTKKINLSDGRNFILEPGASTKISVPSNETLSTENTFPIPVSTKDRMDVHHANTVFVGDASINSDLTAGYGVLSNSSNMAVLFIEVGKDGKRWPVDLVFPDSSVDAVIGTNSYWEVVSPEKEQTILGSTKATGKTRELIFDGHKLSAKK